LCCCRPDDAGGDCELLLGGEIGRIEIRGRAGGVVCLGGKEGGQGCALGWEVSLADQLEGRGIYGVVAGIGDFGLGYES